MKSKSAEAGESFQFDPTFKGPIKNRSCTDILCLFLFLAFLAGWGVVAFFAYREGNPELLIHPTDSKGNVCGMGNFTDKKYLFFFDLTKCFRASTVFKGCSTPQVCVDKCPGETFSVHASKLVENHEKLKKKLICQYNVDMGKSLDDLLKDKDCASFYLQSEPVAGRCLPKQISNAIDALDKDNITESKLVEGGKGLAELMNAREVGVRIFQDFSASWWMIILFLVVSMIVSFLWILLMRWLAGPMVCLSIMVVLVVIGFAAGYSLYTFWTLDTGKMPNEAVTNEFIRNLNTHTHAKNTWLVIGIIFGVIWLILILMFIFLRKRISLAIALIKEGSKAVGCMMSSLFFPLFPYALQLIVFVFWGSVAVCIASAGRPQFELQDGTGPYDTAEACDPSVHIDSVDSKCVFKDYVTDENLMRAQIYNLFGFFWAMFLVVGIGQVSLAGAFASYYWAFDKDKDVPSFAVASSMGRCFRYHLGSVAFGSLLIAIVRMIRVVLDYIDQKCKKYDNTFTKVIMMCCKCCFWCLERFIRFISKNAYIMIAVYGKNFCTAAKDSFLLLMRNVLRVVVLDKVTDYLLFIGKLVVVGIMTVASFFFFRGKIQYLKEYSPELNYYFLPIITVIIGSYLIATGFFNVYSMAVDTLFLSFLEDCERNDGSPERPYYMSKELMKILGKKNKFRDA